MNVDHLSRTLISTVGLMFKSFGQLVETTLLQAQPECTFVVKDQALSNILLVV